MSASSLLFSIFPLASFLILFGFSPAEPGNEHTSATKQFLQSEVKTCKDCHSDLIESSLVHEPAAESCENCHNVDIVQHTENGARGLMLAEKLPDLCYTCHDGIKADIDTLRNVHQAVSIDNKCANCHSPHSSDQKKLLVSEQKKLCISCHNKEIMPDGTKMTNIKKLIENSTVIHPPVKNSGCVVCHQPHGSQNNYLLISAFPREEYPKASRDTYALCWECHDSDIFDASKTETATNFRDGDRNLHYVHVNSSKSRSCIFCHDVHASTNLHLVRERVDFGQWSFNMKYVPGEEGGSCSPGCHTMKTYKR